ncbi:MAG: hypothetical protein IT373_18745, partial [Polyangiaceae bacterium]|nr:hypothetical protein [Polyangiaceae bacterium]
MSDARWVELDVPAALRHYVARARVTRLGAVVPAVSFGAPVGAFHPLGLEVRLDAEVVQDDFRLELEPAFRPTRHFTPHLTPTDRHVVAEHVFRAPAVVACDDAHALALVPDLELCGAWPAAATARWYLDLDAPGGTLALGACATETDAHVLFARRAGARFPAGRLVLGCHLFVSSAPSDTASPHRALGAWLWRRHAREAVRAGEPVGPDLEPLVRHAYAWAFSRWEPLVWQELELEGRRVGAPRFIVSLAESPRSGVAASERETRSVWNQAWFGSLRSASGLWRHARRTGAADLAARAALGKELALAAPMHDGLFPSVLATEMEHVVAGGRTLWRSRGWSTAYWGNSDRNPKNRPPGGARSLDLRAAPFHLVDMSTTALAMLRWYRELEPDPRLLDYVRRYAAGLHARQTADGFFPAWLDRDTGRTLGVLDRSAESAPAATLLFELAELGDGERERRAALRTVEALAREVVCASRWEDFETYWSCSAYGNDELVGRTVERNALPKQTNLALYWTAEALLAAHEATGSAAWLAAGARVVDELCMTQAAWQPPFMPVPVLGGFGVGNADAEWNDARASLFAELLVRYGRALGSPELVERGIAALRSCFALMYCPEVPRTRAVWERVAPWLGPDDHGFTMENFGHDGRAGADGSGMGDFCIYDWGNGSAAEAYERMRAHLGADALRL